ncbi:hypothetical protein [Paraherbaspirillum soli]|uniref:Radical SAM protein n=1 Tax=Paraherbaspirillum soli TaxID=631222 RepID=A0ABW0M8V3_9BURK
MTASAIQFHPIAAQAMPQLNAAAILTRLPQPLPTVIYRAPDPTDDARWKLHSIAGRALQIAQPVTFTPYASARPCSARCRFCSETLIENKGDKPASGLRPDRQYMQGLQSALAQLRGVPMSYSLSGLETTDDPDWMLDMLDILDRHAQSSTVHQRVLYTNAAGLADPQRGTQLIRRLEDFNTDWIELSRHHFAEEFNQAIMRFRPGVAIREQDIFEDTLLRLNAKLPVKLVCIVQRGGIDSAQQMQQYLDWAQGLGVSSVIFREFSKLDERYADNVTARYIGATRIGIDTLLDDCLSLPALAAQLHFERATEGYYFWNVAAKYRGIDVVFEASDYVAMHRQHDSGRVYKLVFHANGNLCADWNPNRHVLFSASREES